MLEIKNVSKKYKNGKFANKNISLKIENGEIFGFIGPNGAGKSTLIKSIVGLHSFDEGEIIFDNKMLKNDELDFKLKLAYIPDNPELYEHLSGIKYINFVCDVYQISLEKRRELIEKYATLFEIKDSLANPISSYSHGMKQKLAIISAFVHEPNLLVLDEPFVGLDPKSSHTLKEIMKEFVSKGNIIFFSSHVLEVVEKLCHHIAIIKDGEIIYDGNTSDIKESSSLEQMFLELTENE